MYKKLKTKRLKIIVEGEKRIQSDYSNKINHEQSDEAKKFLYSMLQFHKGKMEGIQTAINILSIEETPEEKAYFEAFKINKL